MAKPKKLEIEDVLGGDYVARLERAGPRVGESLLAFQMRLGAVARGRGVLVVKVEEAGDVGAALLQLGVRSNNQAVMIRKLGFLREELEDRALMGRGRGGDLPEVNHVGRREQ
jgi:hypothetical protein